MELSTSAVACGVRYLTSGVNYTATVDTFSADNTECQRLWVAGPISSNRCSACPKLDPLVRRVADVLACLPACCMECSAGSRRVFATAVYEPWQCA